MLNSELDGRNGVGESFDLHYAYPDEYMPSSMTTANVGLLLDPLGTTQSCSSAMTATLEDEEQSPYLQKLYSGDPNVIYNTSFSDYSTTHSHHHHQNHHLQSHPHPISIEPYTNSCTTSNSYTQHSSYDTHQISTDASQLKVALAVAVPFNDNVTITEIVAASQSDLTSITSADIISVDTPGVSTEKENSDEKVNQTIEPVSVEKTIEGFLNLEPPAADSARIEAINDLLENSRNTVEQDQLPSILATAIPVSIKDTTIGDKSFVDQLTNNNNNSMDQTGAEMTKDDLFDLGTKSKPDNTSTDEMNDNKIIKMNEQISDIIKQSIEETVSSS